MPSRLLVMIIVILKMILIKLSTSLMREEVEPSECPVIENQRIGAGFQGWFNITIIIRSTITVTIITSTIAISINIVIVVGNIIFIITIIVIITIVIIVVIIIITAGRDSSLPRRLASWPNRPPSTRRHGYYDLDLSFIMII